MIIGGDLTAKSRLWFSGELDDRGALLEDLTMAQNLRVINELADLTTFEDSRGRGSNIDVTLTTRQIRITTPWMVKDDCHSDHRKITFGVTLGGLPAGNQCGGISHEESYNLKKANWPALVRAVRNKLERTNWDNMQPN